MDSIEKLKEELNNNPELQEKINAEAKRIAENKEASDPREAIGKAIKAILDIDLTEEELAALVPQGTELSMAEMEQASGGDVLDSVSDFFTMIGDSWNTVLCLKLGCHDYVWKGEYCDPVKSIFTVRYKKLRCSRCGKAIRGSEYKVVPSYDPWS